MCVHFCIHHVQHLNDSPLCSKALTTLITVMWIPGNSDSYMISYISFYLANITCSLCKYITPPQKKIYIYLLWSAGWERHCKCNIIWSLYIFLKWKVVVKITPIFYSNEKINISNLNKNYIITPPKKREKKINLCLSFDVLIQTLMLKTHISS